MAMPQKNKNLEGAYDPAIPFLGLYPRDTTAELQQRESQQPGGGEDPATAEERNKRGLYPSGV